MRLYCNFQCDVTFKYDVIFNMRLYCNFQCDVTFKYDVIFKYEFILLLPIMMLLINDAILLHYY
jgi:hypothetical protein